MKARAMAVAAILAVPLAAQWLNYATPGLPRTADGKPNLSAPAPRAPDGKPDLSGIWEIADDRPCLPNCANSQSGQEFLNIGRGLKDGLPFKPGMAELAKARRVLPKADEPITRCLPIGIVERHTHGTMRKVVQTPGLLLILNEYNKSYRQIFTDGRPLPADMQLAWDGYSIGKWEGDTLVVTTTGFRDGLDALGDPLTDAGKITERFRRVDFGPLEIELTVDDHKAYTKPWTGIGCVPIYNLMEDAATSEICRTQVWQWVKYGAKLVDGRTVTAAMVNQAADDQLAKVGKQTGEFAKAAKIFGQMMTSADFPEFLTLAAYGYID